MSDASALLHDKIDQVERERAKTAARAEDCLREHQELAARVAELDVVLKHLRRWTLECGTEVREDRAAEPYAARKPLPIRQMVRAYLQSRGEFTGRALVSSIQDRAPGTRMRSIRAELSHCTSRGEARRTGQDQYVSLIAHEGDSTHPTRGETDEPGVGFGRVST